jgi:plastocyanin
VGLVNVLGLKAAGLGNLGAEQPDWLKRDLAALGEHAHRAVRPPAALVGVSRLGLGHRRRRAGALDTGGQYVLSLDTPGTYPYFCTLHPRMNGRIVVT